MGTKTQTITIITCDGQHCGKELKKPSDGIMLMGNIKSLDGELKVGNDGRSALETTILCWDCVHTLLPDMPVKERIVEKPVERIVTRTVEKPVERVVEKIVYRDRDTSNDYSSRYYSGERSGGASGPFSPPELPHYVRVTKSLATNTK